MVGNNLAAVDTIAVLNGLDCSVELVSNAAQALAHLQRVVPDVILISLNLPSMADAAFLRACYDACAPLGVRPVVMGLTPQAAVGAIRAGAKGFVRTPVSVAGVVPALPLLLQQELARASDRHDMNPQRVFS